MYNFAKLRFLSQNVPGMVSGLPSALGSLAPQIIKYLTTDEYGLSATEYAISPETIDVEKREILERLNWICMKVLVDAKTLRNSYPKILGDYYGPQWSVYSCAMLVASLANVSRLWPELRCDSLVKMRRAINLFLSDELKDYDAREWKEDPIASLNGNKSHMTYLSLLAWILAEYIQTSGDDKEYGKFFTEVCEALHRRMLRRKDLNLLSFPGKPVFFPDMLVTIVALRKFSHIYDDRFEETVEKWIGLCKQKWCHGRTGLVNALMYNGHPRGYVRGCYTALINYWLTLADSEWAHEQYWRMKRYLYSSGKLTGIKEYLNKSPKLAFDPNAGLIIDGISPSGTCFAIGPATFFGDWEFRNAMLRTAENAGGDVRGKNMRHYRISEFALVGEATALAMRTHLRM